MFKFKRKDLDVFRNSIDNDYYSKENQEFCEMIEMIKDEDFS